MGGDYVLNLGHDQRNDGENFPMHVASAIMPGFITCASNLVEACNQVSLPAPVGPRMPAGRIIVLTTSPGRGVECWTVPARPARTGVLSSSTCAWARAALPFAQAKGADLGFKGLLLRDRGSHGSPCGFL